MSKFFDRYQIILKQQGKSQHQLDTGVKALGWILRNNPKAYGLSLEVIKKLEENVLTWFAFEDSKNATQHITQYKKLMQNIDKLKQLKQTEEIFLKQI